MLELIKQVRAAGSGLGEITPINKLPASRFADVPAVISGVIDWILILAGALAVIAVVYSGIMYITAGGDSAKAEKGKNNLIWAIIGVVIISLAYVIIQWVQNILTNGTA